MSQIIFTSNSITNQPTTTLAYQDTITSILCTTGNNKNNPLPLCKDDFHRDQNLQNMKSDELFDLGNFDSIANPFDPINQGAFFPNPHVSERSLRLLGIIGGFVLLLLFLAFITCVRQRRLYQVTSWG